MLRAGATQPDAFRVRGHSRSECFHLDHGVGFQRRVDWLGSASPPADASGMVPRWHPSAPFSGDLSVGAVGWLWWLIWPLDPSSPSWVFARKQDLGLAEARGGRRGPENVWGSALTGLVLALLIAARLGPTQGLLIGFAASFAAKLADTFGSEIGKRWGRTTLLITSLRPVPPGTEGAVSLEGTAASALGSLLMTLVMVALGLIPSAEAAAVVVVVGFIATLLESLFGCCWPGPLALAQQ